MATHDCSATLMPGLTFDLTPLRRGKLLNNIYVADVAGTGANRAYVTNDTSGGGVGIYYMYEFNVCGAVNPTTACVNKGFSIPRPAFQSQINQRGFCYALSNYTEQGWDISIAGTSSRG